MILDRNKMLNIVKTFYKRMSLISMLFIIYSIVSIVKNNTNYIMMVQLILFIILPSLFAVSINKITNESQVVVSKTIKYTDIFTIASALFIVGYHIVYRIYMMFNGFEWIELLLLIFSIWASASLWKNGIAYTVAINNLSLFNDKETIDFEDGEWENFLKNNVLEKD